MKRWFIATTLALALPLGLTLGGGLASGGTAFADANERASCVGLGSSDVAPGSRDDVAHEVKALGGPPGAVYSSFAKLHLGSVEECFADE